MAACAISSSAEFRLVRAALREREVLLRAAPHLIRPLRFVLPINEARRSATMLRLGLLLYDWIGWRKILPGTRELDLVTDEAGLPLKARFHHAFEYSDCFADDARLVVLNAVDAAERGAVIRTRTRCVRAERGDVWRLVLNARGQRDVVTARHSGQCRRRLERRVCRDGIADAAAASAAARQRQPHRGAAAVRSRPRLYLAGARPPRRVRHPVSSATSR